MTDVYSTGNITFNYDGQIESYVSYFKAISMSYPIGEDVFFMRAYDTGLQQYVFWTTRIPTTIPQYTLPNLSSTSNLINISIVNTIETGLTPVNLIAPDAPTDIIAIAGNQQATVSFTPPIRTGQVILYYTVTSSNGITATGTSSPITVTGLTNGTPYSFTVHASNSQGAGFVSSSSNFVTPTVAL